MSWTAGGVLDIQVDDGVHDAFLAAQEIRVLGSRQGFWVETRPFDPERGSDDAFADSMMVKLKSWSGAWALRCLLCIAGRFVLTNYSAHRPDT
jgi:hypothetical protein